jgi:hypothetical protein
MYGKKGTLLPRIVNSLLSVMSSDEIQLVRLKTASDVVVCPILEGPMHMA